MRTFGTLLRFYREEKGLSQKELAEKCVPQLSRIYITKLENGTKDAPPKRTVLIIANALSLSEQEFQNFWEAARNERLSDSYIKNIEPEVDTLLKYLMNNLSERELLNLATKIQQKMIQQKILVTK